MFWQLLLQPCLSSLLLWWLSPGSLHRQSPWQNHATTIARPLRFSSTVIMIFHILRSTCSVRERDMYISLPAEPQGKPVYVCGVVLVSQSCLALCYPMDCSPWDSSVHGILQARILDWVAIPFSRVYVCMYVYIWECSRNNGLDSLWYIINA